MDCGCGLPEKWVEFPGEPGYEISDHGRLRSWKRQGLPRILATPINDARGGYPQFRLGASGKTTSVHAGVLRAFVGPRPDGMEIRHLDGDPRNPHVWNLRYGTKSENMQDAVRHGTHNSARKTHCKRGHEFTAENTYRFPSGGRSCRTCRHILGN